MDHYDYEDNSISDPQQNPHSVVGEEKRERYARVSSHKARADKWVRLIYL